LSLFADAQNLRTLETFPSGGQSVRVEDFAGGDENAPCLIVVHGARGIDHANRFIATLARAFALQGFNVYLIHYFDRTGTNYADDEEIRKNGENWRGAVHDAVAYVRGKHPRSAIGIFGYSLGGYLAVAESVQNEDLIAAVVLAGGLDDVSIQRMRRPVPTLVLHGSADVRVPATESEKMAGVLSAAGGLVEVHLYQDEGHILTPESYADVVARGSAFFRKHLGVRAKS
jgi:dipeptidyl aminopeptidase/acylaminoacyl peptidase